MPSGSTTTSDEVSEGRVAAPDSEPQSAIASVGADDDGTDTAAPEDSFERKDSLSEGDIDTSDGYEPPEPFADDRDIADAASFDGASVDVANDENQTRSEVRSVNESAVVFTPRNPSPVSTTEQRTETAGTLREVHLVNSRILESILTISKAATDDESPSQTSFAPYESPLRYFHAFRFHPKYSDGVSGGLKSLTFSNRIDPNKEMCPDEWEGNDCPRGEACQFQHLQNIVAPGESRLFGRLC